MNESPQERRQALATAIESRCEDLYDHKIEAVEASGVARATFDRILKAMPARRPTYRKVESALGWKRDTITRFLAGLINQPEEAEVDEATLRAVRVGRSAESLEKWFSAEGAETPTDRLRAVARLQVQLAEEIALQRSPNA